MGFTDTSLLWRLAFFISIFGFLLTLTGVASTYMTSCELIPNLRMHMGFWDVCDDTKSFSCRTLEEFLLATKGDASWVYGSRAMAVLCLIVQVLTLLLALYLIYMVSTEQTISFILASFSLAAVIFGSIGGAVYNVYSEDLIEATAEMEASPDWSFICYFLGVTLTFVTVLVHFYEACTERDLK